MPEALITAVSFLSGFAAGSIPFGFILGRWRGVDLRRTGSGNIGFTNAERTVGLGWGLLVLLFDIGKGAIPTALAPAIGLTASAVGLGCVLGHVFTPWLGFRGGKGVATALGTIGALLGLKAVPLYLTYLTVILTTGWVSLASLTLAVLLVPFVALITPADLGLLGFALGTAMTIALRHTANFRRLLNGTEPKLGVWKRLLARK